VYAEIVNCFVTLQTLLVSYEKFIIAGGFESFHSTINPEELFRKIFGDAGFNTSGFGGFTDFAESAFGFAPAAEARYFEDIFFNFHLKS